MRKGLVLGSSLLGMVLFAAGPPWAAAQGRSELAERLVSLLEQPSPPPPGRGPPHSEAAFLEREVWKLREKLEREGARFDVDRELSRLADRLAKDFGRTVSSEDLHQLREELLARQSAIPPEGLSPRGPPPGKGPPRAREEFVAHELQKLGEKRDREGDRFDPHRELQKLWEKHQRDYGQPLPKEDWETLTRALEVAVVYPPAVPPGLALHSEPPVSAEGARPSVGGTLPAWCVEHDRDRDGQIGLYEWPRRERSLFTRLDLNGDGFLTPQELQQSPLGRGRTASPPLP